MKREGTIAAGTFLAIAAVVGVSLQTGPKQAEIKGSDRTVDSKQLKQSVKNKYDSGKEKSGCRGVQEQLEDFLAIKDLSPPSECFAPGDPHPDKPPQELIDKASGLKFVIALMPDPLHTHSSALFDQFATAIQEGAQDEKYDFDSSWLPWDDQESSYALLADEKEARRERDFAESQPGIILFRKTLVCTDEELKKIDCKKQASRSYSEGLIVFVVGEEATHGIHKTQFQNALAWMAWLQSKDDTTLKPFAILGPTFSGSLPSLTQLLTDPETVKHVDVRQARDGQGFAIYSGSASSSDAAESFQNTFKNQVVFHSFVQSDEENLRRFCRYIKHEQPGFAPERVAIISEDETVYGGAVRATANENFYEIEEREGKDICQKRALKLYYPRDISALRGAYQTKSLFDFGTSSQIADTQRRNLPTDLADPSGKVHDSIRTYGGNQTPLGQEALLIEIVSALRELQAQYIFLRGSNTLDQLFLANFLRRSYPDGRIVIFGSDLMLIRERSSTGLSGAMTLSTYPLFPLQRDWSEHQSLPAADRTFSSDTSEGTYVAFRLLLNDESFDNGTLDSDQCHVRYADDKTIFLPSIVCGGRSTVAGKDSPIPDYSPPFWTLPNQCGEVKKKNRAKIQNTGNSCYYPGPATWLSVIGVNRFWPIASLTIDPASPPDVDRRKLERADDRIDDPGGRPEVPVGMKVFWLTLAGFSIFHVWCCWSGSYTAKPLFRAHFASTGQRPHTWLIFGGSCCLAFIALVAGWGSGLFLISVGGLAYPWFALAWTIFVWLAAWGAILANCQMSRALAKDLAKAPPAEGSAAGEPDQASGNCALSPLSQNKERRARHMRAIEQKFRKMTNDDFTSWNYQSSLLFIIVTVLFCLIFVVPIERTLLTGNRVLTYWRAMHLTSGVSPVVPVISIFIGLYLSFWFTLHGMALFGPDRPCLPRRQQLALKDKKGRRKYFLRMFSQQDAAGRIEQAAMPLNRGLAAPCAVPFALFVVGSLGIAGWRVPVRSLGSQNYAVVFLLWLGVICSLSIAESWRLYHLWDELRRLLAFLDRLPLRRTMAALRGFSWGSVWKMSGNVLEVRYKVISRQMECMNHTIAALQTFLWNNRDPGARTSLAALLRMRRAGVKFAEWYSVNCGRVRVGDLTKFAEFQKSIATVSGTLLTQLLVPAWRKEEQSLVTVAKDEKEEVVASPLPQAEQAHIRNAEEFVCLNYLSFVQNELGRLRTMALTIITLFVVSACAMSSYPFDPRQGLSTVLVVLFVIGGVVVVKVYADMHRDATLSHVTNTKPGELGPEFWFKLVGFGLAPLIGLITRIFPGVADFFLSWLQPSVSALK